MLLDQRRVDNGNASEVPNALVEIPAWLLKPRVDACSVVVHEHRDRPVAEQRADRRAPNACYRVRDAGRLRVGKRLPESVFLTKRQVIRGVSEEIRQTAPRVGRSSSNASELDRATASPGRARYGFVPIEIVDLSNVVNTPSRSADRRSRSRRYSLVSPPPPRGRSSVSPPPCARDSAVEPFLLLIRPARCSRTFGATH